MTVRKGAQTRSPEVKAFGYNFRIARREKGLSLREVSAKADTAISYLSKMERGIVGISMDKAAELAAVVGKPLVDLLHHTPEADEPRKLLPPARIPGVSVSKKKRS